MTGTLIAPSAKIGTGTRHGSYCIIGEDVVIGSGCEIGSQCDHSRWYPHW